MTSEMENQDDLLLVRTVQCSAIKNLLETLKDILTDCNFIFDKSGIKCLTMDVTHCVIVSVKLNSQNFETFQCKRRMTIGLNLNNLFRLIKSVGSSDTLTLQVKLDDPTRLIIISRNTDKDHCTTYKLNMLDIDEVRLDIPDTNFDSVLTMPSADFQRICRDMATLSDTMGIKSISKRLILTSVGDFAEQKTEIGERDHGMCFQNNNVDQGEVIEYGKFNLKFLSQFSKASVLCGTVDIYLTPKYPLILSYSVASLGRLLFVLASDVEHN